MGADPPVVVADRYQLMQMLGRGGMATVYGAVDRATGRVLALKQLSQKIADQFGQAKTLFRREYHTLSQLSHPCIVRVYDFGLDAAGPYYTMELLDGEDLRALSQLPWNRCCEVLRDVASALSLLHSRRLLHRDINHKNVRCTAAGRAKLLDFGTLASFGTQAEVAGMAPFVAPEALRGQPLDARVDLYSLGCLAYWLLTGRHAYDAQTNDELETLWLRSVPRLNELCEVPETLDSLVMALLSLDPLARPRSAGEVIHRLGAIADLDPHDVPPAVQSSLVSPRLVGRTREIERMRRVLRNTLERVADNRPDATGRFRPLTTTQLNTDLRATTQIGRARGQDSHVTANIKTASRPTPNNESRLVISGPSGCGRSRLLAELVVEAKLGGALVLTAKGTHSLDRAFSTARQLVRSLRTQLGDAERHWTAEQHRLIDAPTDPVTSNRSIGTSQEVLQVERRLQVGNALEAILLDAARERPIVLAVDDLHLCDPNSVGLLASLGEQSPDSRLLVAATVPTEATARTSAGVNAFCTRSAQIKLRELEQDAIEALVRSLFGQVPNAKRLSDWLAEVAQGNPLACMQLVQHLIDRELIRYEDGGWLLPQEPGDHGVPRSVKSAIEAQLARLSQPARSLLHILALHEGSLSLEDWIALGTEDDVAFSAVDELVACGVVVAEGARYRITHELMTEIVVASIDEDELRALHLRIGLAMKARRSPNKTDMLNTAHHLMEGGQEQSGARLVLRLCRTSPALVPSIGPWAAQVIERALDIFERSGRSPADCVNLKIALLTHAAEHDPSYVRYADGVLAQLRQDSGLERFAELDPALPGDKRLQMAVAHARERHGAQPPELRGMQPELALLHFGGSVLQLVRAHAVRYDVDAIDRLAQAVEPFLYLRSGAAQSLYEVTHGVRCLLRGRLPEAEAHYERVFGKLHGSATPSPELDIAIRVWRCESYASLGVRIAQSSDRAFDYADQIDASNFAHYRYEATLVRMLRHAFRGEQEQAEKLDEQLEGLLVRNRSGWHHGGWLTIHKALASFRIGDVLGAQQAAGLLASLSERYDGYRQLAEVARGQHLFLQGELEEAQEIFSRLLATTRAGDTASWPHIVLGQLAVLQRRGSHAQARALAEDSLRAARLAQLSQAEIENVELALHLSCAHTGDHERAVQELARIALEPANTGPLAEWYLCAARAETAAQAGDRAQCDGFVERAEAVARSTGSPLFIARHQDWRARARLANDGEPE